MPANPHLDLELLQLDVAARLDTLKALRQRIRAEGLTFGDLLTIRRLEQWIDHQVAKLSPDQN